MRRHLDRMAVMLPFEEPIWREIGVDARYVGHPALEELRRDGAETRAAAREMFGMTPRAWAVAILPGSRPHEVRRLLTPMLAGYEAVRRDLASVDGRVLLAPSLDPRTRAWARATAARFSVDVADVDARAGLAYALPAFDAALTASGTASLECALARAVPIVCYRVGLATELGARALMTTAHVALPNVLLGRAAFPELLQRHAAPGRIADELAKVLDELGEAGGPRGRDRRPVSSSNVREPPPVLLACAEVEAALGGRASASREVARMLEPWLARGAAKAAS
jgi:lipid-A-disaccharide synthase